MQRLLNSALRCAAALLALGAAPAAAATVSSTVQLTIVAPFTIVKQADLEFGALIPGAAAGTVVIDPTTGVRTTTGGVMGAGGAYNAAQFATAGTPNQHVNIKLPNQNVVLSRIGGGATMIANNFTRNNVPPAAVRLDADGNLIFYIGARLNVGANQMAGQYTGSFDVEITYQ